MRRNREAFFLLLSACACSRANPDRAAPLARTVVPSDLTIEAWDWNGVIGTGQSLAVGVGARQLRSTQPSYRNLKLEWDGSIAETAPAAVDWLREPIRPLTRRYPAPYPTNIIGETPHTAMASQVTSMFLANSQGRGDYVSVHSVVGESGQPLRVLSKAAPRREDTGHAFDASLLEARVLTRIAKQAQRSFGVAAVVLTHGEADATRLDYAAGLYELWQSYNAELPRITGQRRAIPLLATQQSSCPLEPGSVAGSALALLEAESAHPTEIVGVGPRYQYSYADDGVHLDALGYDQLGEKYGQVYFERVVMGRPWRSLSPISLSCTDRRVDIEFHVPVPPLAWDERMAGAVADAAWARGRGFEISAGGKSLEIESAQIVGNRVVISIAAHAPSLRVAYAATAAAVFRATGTRRGGALRDSDPFVGATTGKPAPNYAVTFQAFVRCDGGPR